jgi:hypothetical protein
MNRATRTIVSTIGVILGVAGMNHGFFEALQGSAPTGGLIIQAIGPGQRMWVHGTEEAFTLVSNYLLTGVLAMVVSLVIMVWSVGFIHTRRGPTIFLLLFMLLFLVGGGIGQVLFFLPAWAASRKINSPLEWWGKALPPRRRKTLARVWPFTLAAGAVGFLMALWLAITGILPGEMDADTTLYTTWLILLAAWVLNLVSFVSGFAADLERGPLETGGGP